MTSSPRQYRRLRDYGHARFLATTYKLKQGGSIGRPFTLAERFFFALAVAPPSHLLTLNSAEDGPKVGEVWPLFKKRMNRALTGKRPFIYFGTRANGHGGGGEHLHVLLWDFFPANSVHRQTRELGLGNPDIQKITHFHQDPIRTALPIRYVLAQHTPIFGTDIHLRHQPRNIAQRRWFYPQRATLAKHEPELLSALDRAKSPSASDFELVRAASSFTNRKGSH